MPAKKKANPAPAKYRVVVDRIPLLTPTPVRGQEIELTADTAKALQKNGWVESV